MRMYSTSRGTNFQIDLIRQRRGQKTDFKFGPTISLRGDRTGKIDDPQVAALCKRKVAVEMGLFAGVSHTGVFTSKYDQIGFRMPASKRSEEHTSELQSLMSQSYADF